MMYTLTVNYQIDGMCQQLYPDRRPEALVTRVKMNTSDAYRVGIQPSIVEQIMHRPEKVR